MTFPLLEGLDGVQKMSKSLGNYIGINESANEIFGKLMSISDELMWRYYEVLSFLSITEITQLKKSVTQGTNPRDIKIKLAEEITTRFHSAGTAKKAREAFIAQFQKHLIPENIPTISLTTQTEGLLIAKLLKEAGLVQSTSEGIRLIEQGAVRVNNERLEDKAQIIAVGDKTQLYQVGKRKFAYITLHRKV
jgi:tyrosyl-tRNA synthetase